MTHNTREVEKINIIEHKGGYYIKMEAHEEAVSRAYTKGQAEYSMMLYGNVLMKDGKVLNPVEFQNVDLTHSQYVDDLDEMERLIGDEVSIEDGGFVNNEDAERYANTGYDMELILKRFKIILHHQLQKAREDWLRELQEAVEVKSENELFINPAKLKEILSELDQDNK